MVYTYSLYFCCDFVVFLSWFCPKNNTNCIEYETKCVQYRKKFYIFALEFNPNSNCGVNRLRFLGIELGFIFSIN